MDHEDMLESIGKQQVVMGSLLVNLMVKLARSGIDLKCTDTFVDWHCYVFYILSHADVSAGRYAHDCT